MDNQTFRRILTAFADAPADLNLHKGTLILQVREELIEATIKQRDGELVVIENEDELSATKWLIQRVARLPLLADRVLSHIPDEPTFVSPDGDILDHIDSSPEDNNEYVKDAVTKAIEVLDRRPGDTASVLYLTSDAGEGKTTLINHLARHQAKQYKDKKTDWLIVPVALGGRTFMRFDDVIIGALMNRLRFNILFYDAFIELVRLGVIVPALDGFEEMFVEGSAGDAMSALGNLMQALRSSGSVLIAARKAYFEFKSLRAQTRLFDSIGGQSVTFSRLSLRRWNRTRFLQYATKRNLENGKQIYEEIAAQLGQDHPLLTRAVLVRRVLDVASQPGSRKTLLDQIKEADPSDYFRQFVGSIIVREAQEKWIDKSGEPARPLLTNAEHYELLSAIALEMWTSATEYLSEDVLSVTAEIYAESKGKSKVITHQVVERVKQHALITARDGNKYGFDHQEFFHFFLGEAIGDLLINSSVIEVCHALRESFLPQLAADAAARYIKRMSKNVINLISVAEQVFTEEGRVSIAKENVSSILMRVIDKLDSSRASVKYASFPPDAIRGRTLTNIVFIDCYFQETSLDQATLTNCRFERCEFEGLSICETTKLREVELCECKCRMVLPSPDGFAVYAPLAISQALREAGFLVDKENAPPEDIGDSHETDESVEITERFVRGFMRASGMNEKTVQRRLGSQASAFMQDVLPHLLSHGIVEEMAFLGRGRQRRFRLKSRLETITTALENCEGNFERFLELSSN